MLINKRSWVLFQQCCKNVLSCISKLKPVLYLCICVSVYLYLYKYGLNLVITMPAMGRLNINTSSYQYRAPHVKDKTVSWPSYLLHRNPHTWERQSLYWDVAQMSQQHSADRKVWHIFFHFLSITVPCFNIKTTFPDVEISIIKIRRSHDCLVFVIRLPILVRKLLYIEAAPKFMHGLDIMLITLYPWVCITKICPCSNPCR